MTPLPAKSALDAYFLEARCKLLDVAAILDRIDRGAGSVQADPRLANIHAALKTLLNKSGDRAEAVQHIFSLAYDPAWKKPEPK
jgi:thioredoxin-like negative regulator of GroEL